MKVLRDVLEKIKEVVPDIRKGLYGTIRKDRVGRTVLLQDFRIEGVNYIGEIFPVIVWFSLLDNIREAGEGKMDRTEGLFNYVDVLERKVHEGRRTEVSLRVPFRGIAEDYRRNSGVRNGVFLHPEEAVLIIQGIDGIADG